MRCEKGQVKEREGDGVKVVRGETDERDYVIKEIADYTFTGAGSRGKGVSEIGIMKGRHRRADQWGVERKKSWQGELNVCDKRKYEEEQR